MLGFTFRKPKKEDAAIIHAMLQPYKPYVGTSPIYNYLLVCEHFSDTSIVAITKTGEIIGFVSAYFPPRKSNTLFLWEIAVKEGFHGNGLYVQMVEMLCKHNHPKYVEATVSPSNASSIKRLQQISDMFECDLTTYTLFSSEHFGNQNHEDEILYRIGPIKK